VRFGAFLVLFIYFLVDARGNQDQNEHVIRWWGLTYLILPIILERGEMNTWVWTLPFLIPMILKDNYAELISHKKALLVGYLFLIGAYLYGAVITLPFAHLLFLSYPEYIGIYEQIPEIVNNAIFQFLTYYVFYALCTIFLLKCMKSNRIFAGILLVFGADVLFFVFYNKDPIKELLGLNLFLFLGIVYFVIRMVSIFLIIKRFNRKPSILNENVEEKNR
jgi:hypothetical protein